MFSGRRTFERYHVAELRVVGYYADSLRRVHRRAAAYGEYEVRSALAEGFHAVLHVCNRRIGLYVAEHLVGYSGFVQNFKHLACYAELHQILVGSYESLVQPETGNFAGQLFACSRAEV